MTSRDRHDLPARSSYRMLSAAWPTAGALALLAGCAGHGTYTTAQKEESQQKMAQMKSATEWDMARQSFLAGDLDKALRHADRSIALNEQVAKSHTLRGRILMEMARFDDAVASFQKAQDLDPTDRDARYFMGLAHERAGRKQAALNQYRAGCDLDPTDTQSALAAAEMMIDLERVDEAERFLTERGRDVAFDAGVLQTLGHIAMIKDNPEKAEELFTQARTLAPSDAAITEDLVRAQMELEQFAEAEYLLAGLLSAPEGHGRRDLMHMRARCLVETDRPVEARQILTELTEDDAGARDVEAWIELGHVSYTLGDQGRLRQCSSRAIGLAPQRPEGYVLKSLWQRESGDLDGAIASLTKAAEFSGDDASPLVMRAILARQLGRADVARDSLAQALQRDPNNPTARRLFAELKPADSPFATVPDRD